MDASTARTLNIRRLVAEAGGPAEWSRRYGGTRWQQAQVSQWISEATPKGIGHRLARSLEVAMNLQPGAMDRPPGEASHQVGIDPAKVAATTQALNIVLSRRRAAPLDLEQMIDAQLFAETYAELEKLEGTRGGDVALGGVVADLVTKREERRDAARRASEQAGGPDRGEDRTAGAA